MKKQIYLLIITVLILFILTGCNNQIINNKSKKITFETNGGTVVSAINFSDFFDSSQLSDISTTKDNFIFVSWHTDVSLSKASIASGLYEDSVTFYAKWEAVVNTGYSFDEAFDQLAEFYQDFYFDTYFPNFSNTSNYQITSLGSDKFELVANLDETNKEGAIAAYYDLLLTKDFKLNEEASFNLDSLVYYYRVNETLQYNIYLKLNNNDKLSINIYKENLEKTNLRAEKLLGMRTLNDYHTNNFTYSGLPSLGEIDVLVVPIEIKGYPFETNYYATLETVFNGTSNETGYESVKSFYEKSSYGNLNLNFEITTKYQLSQTKTYYQSFGENGDQEAILDVMDLVDNNIDFSNYDYNEDGVIDSVIFIYSVDYDSYSEDVPWWAWVYMTDEIYEYDGLEFGYYMWASYSFIFDELNNNVIYNAETYIHEMGHLFGLDDYYSEDSEYSSLGGFDMMDANNSDHGPMNKVLLGWVEPLIINQGLYEVNLDAYTNYYGNDLEQVLIIPKNYQTFDKVYGYDEYLLIIYYKPEGLYRAHLDFYGTLLDQGLVVYYVNAEISDEADPWDFFKYNNINSNSKDFVKILEADLNGTLNGNNAISESDILRNGSFNLSKYRWSDNSTINVSIKLNDLSYNQANFEVLVN